ncbi:MAG: S8 family serine peptidase [Phycisphaerales bacterium]
MHSLKSHAAVVASLTMACSGVAMAGGQGIDPVDFQPIPGVKELSGQMLARPVQVNQLVGKGLSIAQAEAEIEAAINQIAPLVIDYQAKMDTYTFVLPEGVSEVQVATNLMASGAFEWVEPNWIVYPTGNCTNDPRLSSQWHHTNMMSCDAWDIETGDLNMIVAVCDTGVNTNHEDLRGRNVSGYNAPNRRSEANGGAVNDINGHGTWVAGTVTAGGNNGVGLSGVAQNVSYMPIRVSNSTGGGAYQSDINNGVLWAIDNGAQIANVSYSGVESSSVRSLGDQVAADGGILVYAGGNDGRRLGNRQWDSDEVITVSASTSSDRKANFSNYGPIMDVIAPGANIWTTDRNGGYAPVSGTSFAAPATAGLLALIWSADMSASRDDVIDYMITGVDDLGTAGWDDTYANGRINSYNSLVAIGSMNLFADSLPMYGGDMVTWFVTNGDPATDTGLFYSLQGEGSSFIPALGVSVDLDQAKQAGDIQQTNAIGDTFWTLRVPNPPRDLLVWIQAAQSTGRLSNVVLTQVNR